MALHLWDKASCACPDPTVTDNTDIDKDFAALDLMSRARLAFEQRICAASAAQDEKVLDILRLEKMFEFAEFYFTIAATALDGPDDIALLAELHNERLDRMLKDEKALERRGLKKDRLLKAIFTSDILPRLEHIWRESPGALDQSNLARFLVTQMSSETARNFVVACEKAGLLTRRDHAFGATVVASTGVMEQVLGSCLREMRQAMARL